MQGEDRALEAASLDTPCAACMAATFPPSLLQAQPDWCFRYLGVPASCSGGASVQLYAARDPAAATVWRLTRVH